MTTILHTKPIALSTTKAKSLIRLEELLDSVPEAIQTDTGQGLLTKVKPLLLAELTKVGLEKLYPFVESEKTLPRKLKVAASLGTICTFLHKRHLQLQVTSATEFTLTAILDTPGLDQVAMINVFLELQTNQKQASAYEHRFFQLIEPISNFRKKQESCLLLLTTLPIILQQLQS